MRAAVAAVATEGSGGKKREQERMRELVEKLARHKQPASLRHKNPVQHHICFFADRLASQHKGLFEGIAFQIIKCVRKVPSATTRDSGVELPAC